MNSATTAQPPSFGPYEILKPLGEGGGGQVYRAWDPRLQREVALKILRERPGSDAARVERFIAEARAASALNHPNIVTVFDAAVDGETPYIVSELINGRPLRDEISRGAVPLKRLLDLATQIADGLSAAHDAGIVHRDLKPENIMITRTGRAKILDFGLAWPGGFQPVASEPVGDEMQTQTEFGLRAGTIPYMSPEQARGSATDFRSDQFSFGLILYEMTTGRPAFRRDTPAATLDAIINDELPPIAAVDARAPLLLGWIVERCLAKDPHDRYGVTADLHRDLRMLRDRLGETVSRERDGSHSVGVPAWRRALGPAAVLMAFAGGVWLAGLPARSATRDNLEVRFTPFAADAVFEGQAAWSPDGQTVAFVAEVEGVLQVFTKRLSEAAPARVTSTVFDCKYPFWSPDSQRIYYISEAADRGDSLWSVGAAGGSPQVVVYEASRGALSRDGRTLAFLRDERPADTVGANELWLSTPAGAPPWNSDAVQAAAVKSSAFGGLRFVEGALAFSPDGRKLGLNAVPRSTSVGPEERGWHFWIVPIPNGQAFQVLRWLPDPAPRVDNFTWLPDSRHVVLGIASLRNPGWELWMADLQRDRAWPLTRSADSEYGPSASPTGEQIVFGREQPHYDLIRISRDGRTPRAELATSRNESDPAWSRDGRLLAYVTDRNGLDEIWVRSGEGHRQLIKQQDFGDDLTIMLGAPAFSPDGQRIAYQRNASKPIWPLRIWITLTAGGAPVPLLPATNEGYQSAPSWSPDGEWIAYTAWKDREWALVKVRVGSGEPPVVLRNDGVPGATPRWSPAGDWITWETAERFLLVSPDGLAGPELSRAAWLVHTWGHDGREVFAVEETEDLRLSLLAVDVRTRASRPVADLGPAPPVNNPVKGLAVSADGREIVTSLVRMRGDLYVMDGVRLPPASPWWRRPFESP